MLFTLHHADYTTCRARLITLVKCRRSEFAVCLCISKWMRDVGYVPDCRLGLTMWSCLFLVLPVRLAWSYLVFVWYSALCASRCGCYRLCGIAFMPTLSLHPMICICVPATFSEFLPVVWLRILFVLLSTRIRAHWSCVVLPYHVFLIFSYNFMDNHLIWDKSCELLV